MIWHSCDLVTCLQAVSMWYHREGPEYISPSSGWINPTLDPWASTNTFIVPKSTFIVILLRSDVWCHQSTLPVLVIDMTSWSKEYRYFVCVWYSNVNLMTWSYCYTYLGVCSSHHSSNDVTPLLTTSNVHDQETLIIS